MSKNWVFWSFIGGAALTALALMLQTVVMPALLGAYFSRQSQPLTIISLPFIEFTDANSRTSSLSGGMVWLLLAVLGGVVGFLAVGTLRLLMKLK